jgi:hypothetical protein
MSIRPAVAYSLALGAAGLGLWLWTGESAPATSDAPAPDPVTPSGVLTVELPSGPTPSGGYRGTGRKQVVLEGGAKQVAHTRTDDHNEVKTPEQLEGERREEELRRVLENLQGEPVYVEGVDGPVPPKAPKKTN